VRLLGAPRIFKEKHVKLKFAAAKNGAVHTALGWRMAESFQQVQCLAGDVLDIAFAVDHNDHPDFGGLELTLKDFRRTEAA
jgi:single-stranded-DNA-specific exonuclease